MSTLRYAAAACQIDLPNPTRRKDIAPRVGHMLGMVRMAVEGYSPFMPVKLLVFPEFAHAAPVYPTAAELRRHLTVPIPNEHTERYAELARELDVLFADDKRAREAADLVQKKYLGHLT